MVIKQIQCGLNRYISSVILIKSSMGWTVSSALLRQTPQIAKFMVPPWGPPGPFRPQMGPMLAPWALLSGTSRSSNSCSDQTRTRMYRTDSSFGPANERPGVVWDEITYQPKNVHGINVDIWQWISNFIPRFIGHVITYPCWDQSQSTSAKGGGGGGGSQVTSSVSVYLCK